MADPWKRLKFATLLTEAAEQVQADCGDLNVDELCDRVVDAVRCAAVEAFPRVAAVPRARWISSVTWELRCARVESLKEVRRSHAVLRFIELRALFSCWL